MNMSTTTDINGSYMFTDVPVDSSPIALNFSLDSYYDARVTGIMVENATTNHTLNVTLEKIPLSGINGTVSNITSTIAGATVYLGTLNTTSNETGYYEFGNVTPGAHAIMVYYANHEDHVGSVNLIPGEVLVQVERERVVVVDDENHRRPLPSCTRFSAASTAANSAPALFIVSRYSAAGSESATIPEPVPMRMTSSSM